MFNNASILLNLFKNFYDKPEDIFDMKKLAKFYALMDLVNVHHALAWHNRRFYCNPITSKLEHIGFDMIPAGLPYNSLLALDQFRASSIENRHENLLDHYIYLNEDFRH